MDKQTRIIIRVYVTDIPGDPLKRRWTLGRLFCDNVLHRQFQPSITLLEPYARYAHIHYRTI
jgi:hypothetical protein